MTQVQQRKRPSPYLKTCPRCGASIPASCKICLHCGELLDPRLIELAKPAKEAEG